MAKKSAIVKAVVNPKSKAITKNRLPKQTRASKSPRGVIYLGRLPKTFFEAEIKAFFSQFGKVLRVRLCRSKKNSHSKGFGYVEFELEQVAKIAAEAANSYFIAGRAIKAELLPKEKVPENIFSKKRMADMSLARKRDARVAYEKAAKAPSQEKRTALKEKLAECGVTYSLPVPL